MMQVMREKTQGIIAGIIVAIIALTFALWGIQNYLRGGSDEEAVVKVNGVKITQHDLRIAYERAKRMQMYTAGAGFNFDQKEQAKLKADVLDKLIKTTALMGVVKSNGFGVGNQQLNIALAEMPVFQDNGQFSAARFQEAMARLGFTQTEFLNELEQNVIAMQIDRGIGETNFVLPNELVNSIRLQNQHRDFGYFIIKPQNYVAAATSKISDDAIRNYYNSHKDEFLSPEKISIEYIVLSADNLKKNIHPTSDQLKKYYQEHLASFAAGDKKQQAQSYEKVAARVKAALERQQLQEVFAEQNDKLTDLAYTNSDSLTPAATALGLKINKTGLFTNVGEKSGILANPKVVKAAFSETTLKQGYNSSPIEIAQGEVMVLRVKEHQPEQVMSLDQVKATIADKLAAAAMKQQATQVSQEVVTALQQGKSPRDLAKKYNLAWLTASNVGLQDRNLNAVILQKAFVLGVPKDRQPSVIAIDLGAEGSAVILLTDVITPAAPTTLSDPQVTKNKSNLEHDLGQFDVALYKDAIMQHAAIKHEAAANQESSQ